MDEYYLKKAYLSMNLQFFADSAADKTEEPTAKKLQDARKEGQVAKSQELVSGAMLFAFFLVNNKHCACKRNCYYTNVCATYF